MVILSKSSKTVGQYGGANGRVKQCSIILELSARHLYVSAMAKDLFHPLTEQIDLSAVLEALSDPIRRDVVQHLMKVGEDSCGATSALSGLSKTNMTYHYARLREAGVTRARIDGAKRIISVRYDDLEARFPGLLPAILGANS
ncbi:hypothetical protein K32_46180 [Kaistia sp. 32K]|uniref:ArsR/SmtB family transcription factor n=1 Tax=Kaistia sp. 32K TaxID=2795690 RepID=UPI00191556E5|nr:helix-turn-helix transcriptional regulator [Kaistia sp. 32K]BCP56001.1 hypothetical protein K32_46180 [Kaistia sp. 32K]